MEQIRQNSRSAGFEKLNEDLERGATNPSNPWDYSFAVDFLQLMAENPIIEDKVDDAYRFREEIVDKNTNRSPVTASYAGNIALRSVHTELFNQEGYPHTHKEAGTWKKDIEKVVMSNKFNFRVGVLDVMSNISARYKTLHVLAATMERRLRRPINIIDIGSSLNHGLKMIVGRPDMLVRPKSGRFGMRAFKQYMDIRPLYGEVIGVEKWVDIRTDKLDIEVKPWAESCSLPPNEMVDDKIRREFHELEELKLKNVKYKQGEIGQEYFIADNPDLVGSADIVFISTTLYQMSKSRRSDAIKQSLKLLTEGGVLVIQDHMRVLADGSLDFNVNWKDKKKMPYRTAIYDTRYPEKGFIEVFKWTDGRVHKGKVADLKGNLALRRLSKVKKIK